MKAKRRPASLRRRLLLTVMLGTPAVWLLALVSSFWGASEEINELFDTQQMRLAQQVFAVLPDPPTATASAPPSRASGAAELEDMAVAAWDRSGRLLLSDREGLALPFRPDVAGFLDVDTENAPWRVYYLSLPGSQTIVAVGQRLGERNELIRNLLLSQLGPWLLMLAMLLVVLYSGLRSALSPVFTLASNIESRPSSDLQPLPENELPSELLPLVQAINRLFARITEAVQHDRRFTADAAHELRTPLAAIQAQWELANATSDPAMRIQASSNVSRGLERMSSLVSQLLALARIDTVTATSFEGRIAWDAAIGNALPDVLALADTRKVGIDVDWVVDSTSALPVVGSADLIVAALRNLVDNAIRYSLPNSRVSIRCEAEAISVIDQGAGVPDALLPRLGDRFFRAGGQETMGSGLGLSIVDRIARLHGLALVLQNLPDGGFAASLRRAQRSHL